ncbi:unnamed protein product [Rotaria socialis]|uniref:Uncharacterized protein n=1 Tax=Rotaria socialis TaxID=392032 RepID=A0A820Q4V9_9BILA|nr:unnamed protein product [Rotaria socialis]CAF3410839.1 unnamed protein product [Rotaria socialis]CAF3466088.1 unnamed protein product [Rotaria socialis]CAF3555133.1 unnamed protein product [Rotaria socialis]CAF3644345.1 unnamed protein product [Rotaria socialis]
MGEKISKLTVPTSTADASTSTAIEPRRRHIAQKYLVIWFDDNVDETSDDYNNTQAQLRSIVNEVIICKEPVHCLQCLDEVYDEKVFIISSDALGQDIVQQIHDMPKVDTIYIFRQDNATDEEWTKNWAKIEGVLTSTQSICESLKKGLVEKAERENVGKKGKCRNSKRRKKKLEKGKRRKVNVENCVF